MTVRITYTDRVSGLLIDIEEDNMGLAIDALEVAGLKLLPAQENTND